jgi:hypothetical protein
MVIWETRGQTLSTKWYTKVFYDDNDTILSYNGKSVVTIHTYEAATVPVAATKVKMAYEITSEQVFAGINQIQ